MYPGLIYRSPYWMGLDALPQIGMYWEYIVHPLQPRDFPRPSRCPSGFALGTALGPREISWSGGCTTHSLIIGREVLISTLYVLLALQGCISWYIPRDGLMMREWPYTASNRDVLGCTSPPTSRFPSALEMSLGLRPRDISRASGNLLVVGDVQPNTSLLSAVYVYNTSLLSAVYVYNACQYLRVPPQISRMLLM